jgi:hypothetical protein
MAPTAPSYSSLSMDSPFVPQYLFETRVGAWTAPIAGIIAILTLVILEALEWRDAGRLTTISAAAAGDWPNRAILIVFLPWYSFFRGVQIILEHGELALDATDPPGLATQLTVALDVLVQIFLILLLGVTVTESRQLHYVFTALFVVVFLIFGVVDMRTHWHFRYTVTWRARATLTLGSAVAAAVFATGAWTGTAHMVVVAEWFLAGFVLTHGIFGMNYISRVMVSFGFANPGNAFGSRPFTSQVYV